MKVLDKIVATVMLCATAQFALPVTGLALIYPTSLTNEMDGAQIDPSVRKLVVFIHGWNPEGCPDSYAASVEWSKLKNSMKTILNGTDWKMALYHWEVDANTGPWWGVGDDIGFGNAIDAVGNADYHGTSLGNFLSNAYPDLRMVHIIAHSAGSWAARSAVDALLRKNPYLVGRGHRIVYQSAIGKCTTPEA